MEVVVMFWIRDKAISLTLSNMQIIMKLIVQSIRYGVFRDHCFVYFSFLSTIRIFYVSMVLKYICLLTIQIC